MPQIIKRTNKSLFVYSDIDVLVNIYIRKANEFSIVHTHNYTADTSFFHTFKEDGIYLITLTVGEVTESYTFPFFPSLIKNISKEFKVFACNNCNDYLKDCGCNDLTTVAKKSLKYNNLASKMLYLETNLLYAYTDAEVANYRSFLYNSLKTLSCKSDKLLEKILKDECLRGISENTELYELLLIIKFIGLYLLEKESTFNLVEEDAEFGLLESEINLSYYPLLYLYKEWSECLCNTCLRLEEVITIFEEGIVIVPQTPTVFPPTCQNIMFQIYSPTTFYSMQLTQQMFSNAYSDSGSAFPTAIIIESLPNAPFVLEDNNGVLVQVGQSIPYSDIGNYRVVATIGGTPPKVLYNFTYRFSNGTLQSSTCAITFSAIKEVNNPPNVINGFTLAVSSTSVLVKKYDLFNQGQVIDAEGDLIDKAKVVSANNVTLELYDGAQYQPLNLQQEIDLTLFTNNGQFIRATPTGGGANITLAFADTGSLIFSNTNSPNNVMTIDFLPQKIVKPIFTGGFATLPKTTKNWMPLSRVSYNSDFRELVVANVVQEGHENAELPFIIIPAESDTPYNIYRNAGAVVVPNTTNPPLDTFDIYAFMDALSTRSVSYSLAIDGEDEILSRLTTNLVVDVINNENPMSAWFTQFNETNIEDFAYLENTETFPANLLASLENPAIEAEWQDIIDGRHYNVPGVGLIGFIFKTNVLRNPRILDATNTDVTNDLFKKFYNATYGYEIYISYDVYAPSSLFFKFLF